MITLEHKLDWLPTAQQELLLQSALGDDESAVSDWERWKAAASFDEIDAGSRRLLPLVYHNLQRFEYKDEFTAKLRNEHRRAFRDNQLLFEKTGRILSTFHRAGIETLILKGAALSVLYYNSAALRPMSDIDLLIRSEDVPKAIELLCAGGWRVTKDNLELYLQISPSCQFVGDDSCEIDLHWQVMRDCWRANRCETFWETAKPFQLGGISTAALSPTNQLFHVCWHGARYNRMPSFRWVADAVTILRVSKDEIEWRKILELAELHRVQFTIYFAFIYLLDKFNAPIPAEFLRALEESSTTGLERMVFRLQSESKPWTFKRVLEKLVFECATLRSSTELKPRSLIFVKYLQYHLKSKSLAGKFRQS